MSERIAYTLGDVTKNFDSARVPIRSVERTSGPYPYYGASGVVDYVSGHLFDGEYLLVAEDGENLRTRKTPVAFMATGKFWVNNHAHVLQGNDLVNTRFLCYMLSQVDISGYLSGSTQPKLTKASLNAVAVRLPGREEQEAVVGLLGALDDKIAVNERIAATALELGATKFRLLRGMAEEDITVGDLVDLAYGKSLPVARRIPGEVPVFGSGGISGSHDEPLVKGPGIVIGRKGTIGVVYWSEVDFFPIDTTFYVVSKNDKVSLEYMYFALRSLGLEHMNSDSAVPGLNRGRVESQALRIPAADAMQNFTVEARALFQLQRTYEEENRTLSTLRDTLLPPLMSGRLRVKDAEKIVEDAT